MKLKERGSYLQVFPSTTDAKAFTTSSPVVLTSNEDILKTKPPKGHERLKRSYREFDTIWFKKKSFGWGIVSSTDNPVRVLYNQKTEVIETGLQPYL